MNSTKNSENMEYPKLDPEFKAKWTAALRSGSYSQGAEFLFNSSDNTYCCLGVACVICGFDPRQSDCEGFIQTENIKVPYELKGDSGLPEKLSRMNDGLYEDGKTFSEIADWIDANL